MNRGSLAEIGGQRLHAPASMRPRFMNRGSGRRAAQAHGIRARFNEAPIHESGKLAGTLAGTEARQALQ